MHDPDTVAFEVRYPWKAFSQPRNDWEKTYRNTFITIWHHDPERDGSDDSCGWFMRSRHGDANVLKRIESRFEFEWDRSTRGWFTQEGRCVLSPMGIALEMFWHAAHETLGSKKARRFMRQHLYDILSFSENNTDSMHWFLTQKYGPEPRTDRIHGAAVMVYGCVLRWTRPWYLHPRWHFWHWRIRVHW